MAEIFRLISLFFCKPERNFPIKKQLKMESPENRIPKSHRIQSSMTLGYIIKGIWVRLNTSPKGLYLKGRG